MREEVRPTAEAAYMQVPSVGAFALPAPDPSWCLVNTAIVTS